MPSPIQPAASPPRFRAYAGPALVTAIFILLVVLVNPLHNFPIGDDWEYARTAQILLTTGEFHRSPIVQATAVFPAVWGALFSALFGFSFTSLRLSTIPLGLGAALAFYAVLGELNFDTARRILGTLTLMFSPLFVFYGNSFMTDVPFLFWITLGLWLSLRAFRLNRLPLMFWGSACAAAAFLTRQLGLVPPLALAVAVLVNRPRSDWLRWIVTSLALPIVAAALFYTWQTFGGQATWADSTITGQGTVQFLLSLQLPAAVARRVVIILVTINLYLAPLWLAAIPALPAAWRALRELDQRQQIGLGSIAMFVFGSVVYFGARGEWWPYFYESLTKAGLWPFLAYYAWPNDHRPIFFPMPVWIGLTFVGAALSVALVAAVVTRRLPQQGESIRARSRSLAPGLRREDAPLRLIYLYTIALALPHLIFPLFFERYFLQFIPGLIVLLLDAMRRFRFSLWPAAVGLLAMGAFSVGLMRDYWGWHEVRWAEAQALIAQGVPLEKLDAGYEWSGWYLSDESYAFIRANGVPMTTHPWEYVIDPEYMMTFTVLPGYHIEKELPFYNPFRARGEDRILLLKRGATP